MADAATNAAAEAKKTINLECSSLVANNSVANWVLSPSSANSTVKKIVRNIFMSCVPKFGRRQAATLRL